MPKRVIDGEGVWLSKKLREVNPEEFRPEFANLIPLALANGTFEADPCRIWARVYAYNRPSITPEKVASILDEFERVGLLRRWEGEKNCIWGYWEGIEKPGRLPPASRTKHEARGPEPPISTNGQPMDSHLVAKGCIGFGSGFGSGFGKTDTSLGDSLKIVWDYYIEKIGKNPSLYTLNPERLAMGKKRLAESIKKTNGNQSKAIELMKLAIDALRDSDFHRGKNDAKKKYDDWEIIFRSASKFEKWLEDANQ